MAWHEGVDEHRTAARYEAGAIVYLGWWDGPEFRTCAAGLRNLSQGGALVHVALAPPAGQSLWLCLAGSPPGDWVEARAVELTNPRAGLHQARLSFVEPCPYEMFRGAVREFGGGA